MRAVVKAVAVLATLVMVLAASPAVAGKGKARVGGVDPSTSSVRIDKVKGSSWKRVDRRTKVVTVDRKGRRTVRDAGQLSRGAKVLGTKVRQGRLKVVRLAARGATGNTDCSFDTDEDDDDRVDDDRSFTCEHDYDDGEVETESDCEVESESESDGGERSTETEWTCGYTETDSDDVDDVLDWECSYSAASERASEEGEGEAAAELEFECGWEGAGGAALWACDFLTAEMGFRCVSEQLGQEFGYTIDPDEMVVTGGVSFSSGLGEDDESDDEGVDCRDGGAADFSCEVEGERGAGDCEVEWELERSREGGEGEVAGALSYSCEWGD
ncbi:hypothetical protein [uncultured Nocardioides sp.]|jgi:hypothetical protein|uniref:hypothetical protein n=1 Tax=uncultured Nocardioides sp. TaxID=198441 RepID=UPI0026D6D52B|nr:hypothetical protein [Nocardioides sp.]|tara:strand:+ start:1849 stop:2829 length:981 start_codon:yes stop_codon:yes gene_type:complete